MTLIHLSVQILLSSESMKYLKFIIISIFLPIFASAQVKNLVLPLGETKIFSIAGSPNIWIQDKEILRAEGVGSRLQIKGAKEGRTTLKIASETYLVQVIHPLKTTSIESLSKEISRFVGLKAQFLEGDLHMTGRLYRLKDWIQISQFARKNSLNYQMRAEIAQELQAETQEYFKSLISAARLPPQTVIFEPHPEIRTNASEFNLKKYQKIFAPFGVTVVRDENGLDIAPTIKVEITVAEIKRDFSQKYGLRWPSGYSAKILNTGEVASDELPFNLTALENQGFGKILASPNILCRSGKEAEFLAGGEFPIKIMNFKTQDVVWKRYGILLKVKPKADSAGRISLSIETEVTTLDASRTVDDIPGLLTNRVSSHFDLTKPQTIALSGLIKNEDSNSSEGLPWLSRLPVLGALFSSKDYKENRSELVIFVRPTLLNEDGNTMAAPSHLAEKGR